ncbi:MAG: hypothetical protein ABUK01_12940 [Leptospirales bacterium]
MIDTAEKLQSVIRLKYRFLKSAAVSFGFAGNKNYQRFRNTMLGASKDYQVISALLKKFPDIDTTAIWSIDKKILQNAKSYSKN